MGKATYGIGLDFDNPELYRTIQNEAAKGKDQYAIAVKISEKFGIELPYENFAQMASSQYSAWSERENRIYGRRIHKSIERGKSLLRQTVRTALLQTAIGGRVVKTTSTRRRKLCIDGKYTEDEVIETVTNEQQLPPNLTAMMQWLHHNDPEWRKQNQNRAPEDLEEIVSEDDIPQDIEHGIDINKWIEEQII